MILHTSPYGLFKSRKLQDYVQQKFAGAVPIEEIALDLKGGGYTNYPGYVFWQADPPNNYSNFFVIYRVFGVYEDKVTLGEPQLYVRGLPNFNPIVDGVTADGKNILISRYVHDYFCYGDAMIDGGRNYTRRSLHPVVKVNLLTQSVEMEDGKIKIFKRPPYWPCFDEAPNARRHK